MADRPLSPLEQALQAEREAQKKTPKSYEKTERVLEGTSTWEDDPTRPIYQTDAEVEAAVEAKRKALQADPKMQQQQLAHEFEQARPGMESSAMGAAAGAERRRLAGEMAGIKAGASRKGLLYSGMRQGAEAGARGASDVSLAQQKMDIKRSMSQTSDALKKAPISAGLSVAQAQNTIANQAMDTALSNLRARNESISKFGSSLGKGIGSLMANRGQKPDNSMGEFGG